VQYDAQIEGPDGSALIAQQKKGEIIAARAVVL